ncbi:MAG: phosphoribosylanthranilate isomerase [Hyphomicrobiaceae bacterium]
MWETEKPRKAWGQDDDHVDLIHVAGVIDAPEAELLIDCGMTRLGFPLVLDHHSEDLSVAAAADIVARYADRATFFLITYLGRADDILSLCQQLDVKMVQLHGPVTNDELQRLRTIAPDLTIIKSLVVGRDNAIALQSDVALSADCVDGFITDTFDPISGASGATGRVHDWAISRQIVVLSPKPVILAGGLNPENVASAIDAVRPAGVDVHTGLEGPDGRKRADLTARFVAAARTAFAKLSDC